MTERTITFAVDERQAEVLLKFLKRVSPKEVALLLDRPDEWEPFNKASERLRVALRDAAEQ
jgi:hypothetical protein